MQTAETFENYQTTMARMPKGVLLVTGKGNPMTIGWGQLGIMWGKPVFTVMVRPSRYSFEAISRTGEFTVNVMPENAGKILGICGAKSGRDTDKLALCGLTAGKSRTIQVPYLEQAEMVYECRTIHRNLLAPETLPEDLLGKYYPQEDFHTYFFGEVLQTWKQ